MEASLETQQASGQGARGRLAPDIRERFEQAAAWLEEGRDAEALSLLRELHATASDHAGLRSLLGLAVARAENDFERARALCEEAARQEFFNPELYLNLARVYLRFGRRSEALRYLRRGKMIDPGHAGIQRLERSLGNRQLPIVPFLPRRHALNRALGAARSRLSALLPRS